MGNTCRVPFRKGLAAALLLLAAAALPQLLWMGAHGLAHPHHEHAEEAEHSALAKILVHGHEHEEGVPDHEHHLLTSPLLRLDTPQDLQAPDFATLAFLKAPEAEHLLSSSPHPRWGPVRLSGSSPPPDLLCILRI